MANSVFANGREIACKAGAGKTICAMPDVCFTPPENPATPPGVPVPYPNTGKASDTSNGSKKVMISGEEIMLKDSSYFKTSMGDEAGCAAKKGVITSNNKGKVYFQAWSMDVKFEGENVDRHLDITTNNHRSMPGDTPTWPYVDQASVDNEDHVCHKDREREKDACEKKGITTKEQACADNEDAQKCRNSRFCMMVPFRNYSSTAPKTGRQTSESPCCKKESEAYSQPHHLIEDNWVKNSPDFPNYSSTRGISSAAASALLESIKPGSPSWASGVRTDYDAPCVCAEGDKWEKEHGWFHCQQAAHLKKFQPGGSREGQFNYGEAKNASLETHRWIAQSKGVECNQECLEKQLDIFYGDDESKHLDCDPVSMNSNPEKGVTGETMDNIVNSKPLTHNPFSGLS